MAAVCYNAIMNTTYQEIRDSIIKGACGSFATFPENGKTSLFINPTGVGGCSTDIRNGILFAGSDAGNFIIDKIGVVLMISSWAPTVTAGNSEVALGYNAADGPIILALAQAIVYSGFITIYTKKTVEVCMGIDRLQGGGGLYVEMAGIQDGCSEPANPENNQGCLCPFAVHVANGSPDSEPMKAPHAMVLSNTSSVTAEYNAVPFQNADGACISALDMAAVSGSEQTCTPSTTCPVSKLSDFSGLVQVLDLRLEGLACTSLC